LDSLILTYHALDDSGAVVSLAPEVFREQMKILAGSGLTVSTLREAAARPGSVALTFDDAYSSFYDVALPELAALRFPATLFVVSGACGKRAAWPYCAASTVMSWDQLRGARDSGIEIGAHTATHPWLARISDEAAAREIDECRGEIAARLGAEPESFAYPYGESSARVRRLVAGRFRAACGIELRPVDSRSDPFDLPRIDIHYFRDPSRFRDLLSGARGYLNVRRMLRAARKAVGAA
jgi:peptidoglycan/xylan/chitin deacetylase (PgdA/CDA1 family)